MVPPKEIIDSTIGSEIVNFCLYKSGWVTFFDLSFPFFSVACEAFNTFGSTNFRLAPNWNWDTASEQPQNRTSHKPTSQILVHLGSPIRKCSTSLRRMATRVVQDHFQGQAWEAQFFHSKLLLSDRGHQKFANFQLSLCKADKHCDTWSSQKCTHDNIGDCTSQAASSQQ